MYIEIKLTYPNRKRECLFYLGSANYKIGEYRKALGHINELLTSEPNHPQAIELKDKIEKKLTNGTCLYLNLALFLLDGVIGLAVAGGLAAAVAGIFMVMYRSKRKWVYIKQKYHAKRFQQHRALLR